MGADAKQWQTFCRGLLKGDASKDRDSQPRTMDRRQAEELAALLSGKKIIKKGSG